MTEILTAAVVALLLTATFALLVRFARHDVFAGPGTGHQPHDELGPLSPRRRAA